MGIDYENMRFTQDNHEMLPVQAERLVRHVAPREIVYIDIQDHWTDPERKTWIDGNAPIYELDEADMLDESIEHGRLIATHDGLVLDLSHLHIENWVCGTKVSLMTSPMDMHEDDMTHEVYPLPIVHVIHNAGELELAQRVLSNYNIDLRDSGLEKVDYEELFATEMREQDDELDDGTQTA